MNNKWEIGQECYFIDGRGILRKGEVCRITLHGTKGFNSELFGSDYNVIYYDDYKHINFFKVEKIFYSKELCISWIKSELKKQELSIKLKLKEYEELENELSK
jgi:hypothetical protein